MRASARAGSAPTAPYGYLVAPSVSAWAGIVNYLELGGEALVLDEGFRLHGRDWPRGTIFLPTHGTERLSEKVRESGLADAAVPVQSGLTAEGHDLGTESAYRLELPRVGVLMGRGVSPTSYGAHWFFLERTLGLAFDGLPKRRLESIPLEQYDVLVLPDMWSGALEDDLIARLEEWVREGGTLVAVAGGARAVAKPLADIGLRDATAALAAPEGEASLERALRGREERELDRWEQRIPGTILRARLDPAHPLAFGVGAGGDRKHLFVLHRGDVAFEPEVGVAGVAYFPENLQKVSGVISEENLERLSQASWLVTDRVGAGRVVLFADDPLFRHFWHSTFLPYVNALLIAPQL